MFELFILLLLFLLQCGHTESNSGLISHMSLTTPDTSLVTYSDEEIIRSIFSMVYDNIKKLSNKINIIEPELKDFNITRRTSDTDIEISGFKLPCRRDRMGDNNGGFCVHVKDSIFSKRRSDLEMSDIECIWIRVSTRHKIIL